MIHALKGFPVGVRILWRGIPVSEVAECPDVAFVSRKFKVLMCRVARRRRDVKNV